MGSSTGRPRCLIPSLSSNDSSSAVKSILRLRSRPPTHSLPASAASSTGALPNAHCAGVSSRFSARVSTRWLSRRFLNLGSNAGARFACAASARISSSLRNTPSAGFTRRITASSKGSSSTPAAMSCTTMVGSSFLAASSISCENGCRSSAACVIMAIPSERSRLPLAVCSASSSCRFGAMPSSS